MPTVYDVTAVAPAEGGGAYQVSSRDRLVLTTGSRETTGG